ncbi:MAG TPA: hypothetical protein VIJ07_11920, partial [Dermatophilaceae bacterium]
TGRATVPHQHRHPADQSRSRQARRPAHYRRHRALPEPGREEHHPAHSAAHLRDDAPARRIDTASIALWLGHATIQTTQVYLHADLELKRRTLERLPAIDERPPARYQASDALIAFLANR